MFLGHPEVAGKNLALLSAGLAILCANAPAFAGVEILPTNGRNVYRLAVGRLGGEHQIIGSTYDNRVCAFDANGKPQWDAPVGGFVFDLAAGDLDADGRDEIVAACADGKVCVFSAEGKPLWQYDLLAPVYQVAFARLDGETPVVLAGGISRELTVLSAKGTKVLAKEFDGALRLVRAGNFEGGPQDAVVVFTVGSKKAPPGSALPRIATGTRAARSRRKRGAAAGGHRPAPGWLGRRSGRRWPRGVGQQRRRVFVRRQADAAV